MKFILRSMLFVPAYNEKFMKKANNSCYADGVILDLEDSVPMPMKEKGRLLIRETLSSSTRGNSKFFIRVNELGTKDVYEDMSLFAHSGLSGIMLPKIKAPSDIWKFDALAEECEIRYSLKRNSIKFIPLIENASAVINLKKIVRAGETRIVALAFGGEDYLDSIGGVHTKDTPAFDEPRAKIVQIASMNGIASLDTPYLNFRDEIGFRKYAKHAKEIGFSGSLVLTPLQAAWANEEFSPSDKEILWAKKVVGGIEKSNRDGNNVVVMDGVMFGPPMCKRALKIMELANLIGTMKMQ